jgi:tRNA (guanine37-N1)-methyltransferase
MRLDIVSLFPSICAGSLSESIIGRAVRNGLVAINLVDLREFTHDLRRTVDDTPYGGGAGMVLRPEPLFKCIESLASDQAHVILLTPQGQPFKQKTAARLAQKKHLILVCGHYEGVDERARQCLMHEEISLGDYVLTNGAIAAAVVADAVIRLIPGVLGSPESPQEESFGKETLLEYPQYTKPENFQGLRVPAVLLSGNHQAIAAWREEQRLIRTLARRPDLLHKQLDHREIGDENEHN